MEKNRINDTESLRLHFRVKNIGTRKGKEIIQLYVCKADSAVRRPERELREFSKVELEPGEERQLNLTLSSRAFSYYESKIHDWYVEEGAYTIEIAVSSREIRLSEEVWVESTRELPFTYTRYSTIGDLNRSQKGRELVGRLLSRNDSANDVRHLGEGSEKRTQETALAMPLNSLVTFGRLTEEQLDELIMDLNKME